MNYMIQHYLKTAIRNLLKYKTHSIISAICLSVGMTCFSIIHFFINEIDGASRNLFRTKDFNPDDQFQPRSRRMGVESQFF